MAKKKGTSNVPITMGISGAVSDVSEGTTNQTTDPVMDGNNWRCSRVEYKIKLAASLNNLNKRL